MSRKKSNSKVRKRPAILGELTLIPRETGSTTESAYRQSLEASPTYKLVLPKPKSFKKPKRKK